MSNVSVQHVSLPLNTTVRQTDSDKPMVWAVRKDDGSIVHVAQLTEAERGLRCECECPACKSPLQAVNAGVGPEHFLRKNTRGQFFRHPPGQQRDGCLLLMARVAALQLLFERGEIDLPGPRQRGSVTGASGSIYIEDVRGPSQRIRVRSRAWIDTQSATLTLDDGRVVLLKLASDHRVSDEGRFDGVIAIQVDDPEVASWPADKILQHAQLDDGLLCWNKHWNDELLQVQAQGLALNKARNSCDWIPDDDSQAGLTAEQRGETALHLAVKMILANAAEFRSPIYEGQVEHVMPSGRRLFRPVKMNLGLLQLRAVELEKRLGDMVPDVVCRASASGTGSFDLLIEVAVTHRVDEFKRQKIVAMNIPCIEIDITKFQVRGRISLQELANEVLNNRSNKAWIHHPHISQLEDIARRDLAREASAIQEQEVVQHRMRSWLDTLDPYRLHQIYFDAVVHLWSNDHLPYVDGEFVRWEEIVHAMKRRGWLNCDQPVLVAPGGILHSLVTISRGGIRIRLGEPCYPIPTVLKFFNNRRTREYISYALMALKLHAPPRTVAESQQIEEMRRTVLDSLKLGHTVYARSRDFDSLVSQLFPEMAEGIKNPNGTAESARKQRKKRVEAEQLARSEFANQPPELDQQRVSQRDAQVLRRAIDVAARVGWAPHTSFANDLEQVLRLGGVVRLKDKVRGLEDLLASAWKAREVGTSLAAWYRSHAPQNAAEIKQWQEALREAWLTM